MDREQTDALQQMVEDQAERLGSVQEQVSEAKWALLDHDLDRLRYWLNQIEETSGSLPPVPTPLQAARQQYA
jgi:hypothetical protein